MHVRLFRGLVVPTDWAHGLSGSFGPFAFLELYQSLSVRSWGGVALQGLLYILAVFGMTKTPRLHLPSVHRARGEGPDFRKAVVFLILWITIPVLASFAVTLTTSLHTFGLSRYHGGCRRFRLYRFLRTGDRGFLL